MPFCTNCGTQIGIGNAFCTNCGTPVSGNPGKQYSQPHSTEETPQPLPENSRIQEELPQPELWEPIKGSAKSFPLMGASLEVSEQLDLFNSYRLLFRELAFKCADKAEAEYKAHVFNFVSFMDAFPKIYSSNLDPLIQKAIDILIAENVWTVTFESFKEQHLTDFHLAFDAYSTTLESIELTIAANQQRTAGITSYIPNMVGGGFGITGMLKGVAAAAAFNVVRDGIENAALQNAANLKPAQQAELFARINPLILMEHIFSDYWRVFLSLVWTLNQNNHQIWWPSPDSNSQADNIFQNLSNPNFPQDKIISVIISMLQLNPFNAKYYNFISARFGDTSELSVIKDYFGYSGSDPRIC